MSEYNKYSGLFKANEYTNLVKMCHQYIKDNIIHTYSNNINLLIDIGSGRGHDYSAWLSNNIKNVIGIEPSEDSIISAIRKYIKNSKINRYPKIKYLRGVGNKLWNDGSAALNNKDINFFKSIFKNNLDANSIHMFWTIHYCMNTKTDFFNLFNNINQNLVSGGTLIILLMNGSLIHKLLKKHNGSYKNITKDGQNIFEINGYYDYNSNKISPYGNTIGVKLAGAYGLDNEIKENLVVSKFLISFFEKNGYQLILNTNFIKYANEHNIECIKSFNIFQKRISAFYDIIILNKN